MKKFELVFRKLLFTCVILVVSLCYSRSLEAQIINENVPGTFKSLSENQPQIFRKNNSVANNANIAAITTTVGLQQVFSSTGHYTISADGKGSTAASTTIRVDKPNALATVHKVILISSVTGNTIGNGCVSIAGVPVSWDGSASVAFFNNYWADVTSIVAAQINAFPAGISTLNISECNTGSIDGEALLVVFNDASATEKTIIIMCGAMNPQGDNFSVTLAQPIDPNQPGALLDMGLGIGFGFQLFGGGQTSQVSVNGQRLTSSAGGEDDGASANGGLITVGGIGDVNSNPLNPFAGPTNFRSDDELYNILPFITNTTTSLTISTINPSLDDNIFLSYFVLSGAAVIGEGILLSQTSSSGAVGTDHSVKAAVLNSLGQPIANRLVTFTITSGPNAGGTYSTNTDASGEAYYTYTGNGNAGTDNIQACFTNGQNQLSCSNSLSFEWLAPTQSVSTNSLSSSNYCQGATLDISYTATGSYNSGNIFSAELSNASGSFITPTAIGSVNATTSGTINATIPANIPGGAGYRIRVVSSDPVVIGTDNGSNLTINEVPVANISANGPTTFCPGGSVKLTASAGASWLWSTGETTQEITVNQTGNYSVTVRNAANCSATSSSTAVLVEDNLDPIPAIALLPDLSAECSLVVTVFPTATDNCTGVITATTVDPLIYSEQGDFIIHWKFDDGNGNIVIQQQNVKIRDITKPSINCPANQLSVPFDFAQTYATIVIGTATATDNCAANINIAITGIRSDNVTITNQQYPLGQTTVAWSATDPSSNSSGCTQTITVRKRNTSVTYTGDMVNYKIRVQYSDIINLKAKLTDNEGLVTPNNIAGRSITFQLLSGTTVLRSKSATTDANGVAIDTFKVEQAPGLYSVKTIFAGDSYFNGSNDQDNCEVKQEDAVVEYNGSQYFTTPSATTLTGSITLAASINDIDDGSDKRGDIRKAKATFRDGGPAGNVLGSANLPVGLVNPGVLTNGLSATTQNNITLNSNDASSGGKIFQVWVGASDHYVGADAGPTPVTLALPGQDFVTGGGHLVVTNSAGTYAGTVNSKMNFGFTMKWNKSGKNLQGNINIVFRKWQLYNGVWQWRVYQVKSNAINSMAVVELGSNGQPVSGTNPAAFRKAIITTKANLKDVTDPLNNIDLGGNHNLTLDAWDHITANGGVSDKISVTLMGSTTNELLFSSSWISNTTTAQTITGGNVNVRNGSSSSSTSINSITKSGQMEVTVKESLFVVKAYPNPTEHEFTLIVNSRLNEKIEIELYDAVGRKIQTLSANANETISVGEKLKTGVYIAKVIQGNRSESIKLIKQ